MTTGSRCSDVQVSNRIQTLYKGKNIKKPIRKGKDKESGQNISCVPAAESVGVCYVCGRKIKSEPVYIGKGLFRHESCYPGSMRWINSDIGRASALHDILIKDRTGTEL
jgi:hypothetical protein